MSSIWPYVFTGLGAIGASEGGKVALRAVFAPRREAAEVGVQEADAAGRISETALSLIKEIRADALAQINDARREASEARREAGEARVSAQQAWAESVGARREAMEAVAQLRRFHAWVATPSMDIGHLRTLISAGANGMPVD